jgi:hypothetical protein
MGVDGKRHVKPLYPCERDQISIVRVQEARWALGQVWTVAENLAPTEIRFLDRPARSEWLLRLRYPGRALQIL